MFYCSGGNPADQSLADSSDFLMNRLSISYDSSLGLLGFSCLVSFPTHLILPTKQAVLNLGAHADMPTKRKNLLVHQPLLYLIVQCFGSNLILLCVNGFSVPSITATTCTLTPRGRVRASAFFYRAD